MINVAFESNPENVQTANDIPGDPVSCKTPFGDTKIPDPTIMPTITETASNNPNSLLQLQRRAVGGQSDFSQQILL